MFSVREAAVDDLEVLVHLRIEFLREVNAEKADEVWLRLRENLHGYLAKTLATGEFRAWLAEAEGEIIGTSGLVFFQRPPSVSNIAGLDAYIMNVYTLPPWRGRGVATTLLHHILDYVKTTPSRRVFLHATAEGRPIYLRAGFTSADDVMELLVHKKVAPV